MYSINETKLSGKKMMSIRHLPTGNYASIIVDFGGALNAFVVDKKHILRSAGNDEDFKSITKKSFAGAQLFPFPNRVNNATYSIDDKEYLLPLNDDAGFSHSLHGLIYNQPFTISQINETEGKVVLKYHFKKNKTAYPFEFLLNVEYVLSQNCLQVNTCITNLSKEKAPIGYGWHPYIVVAGKIDDCKLQLPASKYYVSDDRLIPNGETEELKNFEELSTIGSLQLNQCFEMPSNKNCHTTIIEDIDGTCIQVVQNGFGYTQYYTPPDRISIAIEPQTCIPNALNNGIGLMQMQPDETLNFSFKITVQKK